jgi:hypothetical protein
MRLALVFLALAIGTNPAAADWWSDSNCARGTPEPALDATVSGHRFSIDDVNGVAHESGTIRGVTVAIVHDGCESVGWRLSFTYAPANTNAERYDLAASGLETIRMAAPGLPLDAVIAAFRQRMAEADPRLGEDIVVAPGAIPTRAALDYAGTDVAVTIVTGPL